MKVVILAGGRGTRLREETEFRPKPMVEIGGRPILWHIMKLFAFHGLTEFVVAIGYKGEAIKDYFLNYQARNNDFTVTLGKSSDIVFHNHHLESDWRVTVVETGQETQTGGRVRRTRKYVDEGPFMVTYGDGVADVDINRLLAFHRSHGRLATLTSVRPVSRFGVLDLDEDNGTVRRFREKGRGDGWVNAGFFVFEPAVFGYLDGDGCVLEEAPLRALAEDGELRAYMHDGFFQPMDTYREARLLNELWATGAPWRVWQ
ncbi:MAG: glucose-1-phosphate cytidylyltransferase [Acidimicrobiales bacterium]